ncbi:hypothetical protein FRUB_03183 [Fimbriiglobus ruber]|uniref:Uncharacterized protein n=1 Tax=Fimbriiglobus ruber TaxID=1908690 RepID=A0A225DVA2_9BACT|nr:hypothetical protein FRUB_03183 [Fimbriiglobus ruber]
MGSAVAGTLTNLILYRVTQPPDAIVAVLGVLWIAMPFLAASMLAVLLRRNTTSLVVLMIALLVVGAVGVSLMNASVTQQEIAQIQAQNAVLPGEDPDHGPGGMRKSGADLGVAIGGAFQILLAVILPPVQLAAVVIPTGVGYGISAWLRSRQRVSDNREDEG